MSKEVVRRKGYTKTNKRTGKVTKVAPGKTTVSKKPVKAISKADLKESIVPFDTAKASEAFKDAVGKKVDFESAKNDLLQVWDNIPEKVWSNVSKTFGRQITPEERDLIRKSLK